MMKLGSEGVYPDEKKCRTNPSRYLPGPKTPVKKKNADFGVSGVRAYKIECGAALKGPYSCT